QALADSFSVAGEHHPEYFSGVEGQADGRQLASRAWRRVQGAPIPDPDLSHQWEVVEAFLAASRAGDFDALLQVLDPDVILRAARAVAAGGSRALRGAAAVAGEGLMFSRLAPF